jgi:hypothetical protein
LSDRPIQLFATADGQISELEALLSTADEALLGNPCPGREKLADGTVAAVAQHTADSYLRIAQLLRGHSQATHAQTTGHDTPRGTHIASPSGLIERLAEGRRALEQLAQLTDEQLDSVPPAGQARFCDGQRTLEQVLASMLKHQSHQIDTLRAVITPAG